MELVTPETIAEFTRTGARFAPLAPDFPETVLVDVTTRCNLTCAHCPNATLSARDGFTGDMDVSLFKKIVHEVAAHPDTWLRPLNSGEPLLRRDLPDLIRYAKDQGVRHVGITTNGTLLDADRRRRLIEAGVDQVEVSLDAATAATFKSVRHADAFDRVVGNTLRYIEEARGSGSACTVLVSFVSQTANHHEVDAFIEFWQGKADAIYVREYHQHNNLVGPKGRVRTRDLPYRHPCVFPFERVVISYAGLVRFCCFDWESRHSMGDVRRQTLEDIWQGAGYRRLREQHIAGTFDHPFCLPCTDWREVRWPGQ